MSFLSIVVLSYNRPVQIERILNNFIGVTSSDFNIIIKDDVSPLRNEIKLLVDRYSEILEVGVVFHSNEKNLGYDGNLIDSFFITNSDYVFLLSDDDYVVGSKISSIINSIKSSSLDFYFTPYYDCGAVKRVPSGDYDSDTFSDLIYNSILFSGLVYRVDAVKSLALDHKFLSKCIYSQVYLSIALIHKQKRYGVLSSDILYLGGDGDNFFGKNDSASNSVLLSDRKKVYSNFIYQNFLLKVVDRISSDFGSSIGQSFYKEYCKRLISYGFRVRGMSFLSYLVFLKAYFSYSDRRFLVSEFFFLVIFFIPSYVSKKVYEIGVKSLRTSG